VDEHRAIRIGFFTALLGIFAYLAWLIVRPFLTFVLAALLLAFSLFPLQERLSARIDSRVSAGLLVTAALGVTVGVIAVLLMALPVDAAELSMAIEEIPATDDIERLLEDVLGIDVPLESFLAEAPRRFADLILGDITGILEAAIELGLGLLLFVFLLYYLLESGDQLTGWVKRVFPLAEDTTAELFEEGRRTTWAVLKSHVFIAVIQALVAAVGLLVVGIPNVVFWTVVMMLVGLMPIVGVVVVMGPAFIYLIFVERFLAAAFLGIYGMTVVAVVDDYLRAYIVDRGSSLHTGVILVGVLGGVYAFGVMGLFYGPIILGLFQTLVRLFNEQYVDGGSIG
jgi:predicted PurR-regulated permease PerM